MPEIFDYFVPWLKGQKMYFSPHIDLAWKHPELHRLMDNATLLRCSEFGDAIIEHML